MNDKCIVFVDETPIGLESQINEWIHENSPNIIHVSHSWTFEPKGKSHVSALIIYHIYRGD